MPAWLITVLGKLGIDIVLWAINYLEAKGVISAATAEAARIVHQTKIYYKKEDFPGGVNGMPDSPVPDTSNANLVTGEAPKRGPDF